MSRPVSDGSSQSMITVVLSSSPPSVVVGVAGFSGNVAEIIVKTTE